MGRKFAVSRLPADVRGKLDEQIDDDSSTIDGLNAWLASRLPDLPVSRSARARYVQRRKARSRAAHLLAETSAEVSDSSGDEAVDLMLELSSVRIREARILARLSELGVV